MLRHIILGNITLLKQILDKRLICGKLSLSDMSKNKQKKAATASAMTSNCA